MISLHTFCGLAGTCMNPGSFSNSLFMYVLVCPISLLFPNGFQALFSAKLNLCQHCFQPEENT